LDLHRDLQCQPGLADPARTGKGYKQHIVAQQEIADRLDLAFAADQRRKRSWHMERGWGRCPGKEDQGWHLRGNRLPGRRSLRAVSLQVIQRDTVDPGTLDRGYIAAGDGAPDRPLVDAQHVCGDPGSYRLFGCRGHIVVRCPVIWPLDHGWRSPACSRLLESMSFTPDSRLRSPRAHYSASSRWFGVRAAVGRLPDTNGG
jgi:hypothetical protein